jgi:hypothetical protein
MKKLIKTLFSNSSDKKNNLSSKEINRRLEIIQDTEKILKKHMKVFDENVLKAMQVYYFYFIFSLRKTMNQAILIHLIMIITQIYLIAV